MVPVYSVLSPASLCHVFKMLPRIKVDTISNVEYSTSGAFQIDVK